MEQWNMEKEETRREYFPLVSVKTLIPGIDERKRFMMRDASFYSDAELSGRNPFGVHGDSFGKPLACSGKNVFFRNFKEKVEGSEELRIYLREVFGKTVLVDIGSGGHEYGIRIAEILGSKGYIAVEPYFFKGAREFKSSSFPVALVAEDAETFLRRVPDNAVSLLVSRIDGFVIANRDSANSICREMARVLSPLGGALVHNSTVFPSEDFIETENMGTLFSIKRKK